MTTMLEHFEGAEVTVGFMKPDITLHPERFGHVLELLTNTGLTVVRFGGPRFLTNDEVVWFYSDYEGAAFIPDAIEYLTRSFVTPFLLIGEDAVAELRKAVGATKPWEAGRNTIRGMYGKQEPSTLGNFENCIHASDSCESVLRDAKFFFPQVNLEVGTGRMNDVRVPDRVVIGSRFLNGTYHQP